MTTPDTSAYENDYADVIKVISKRYTELWDSSKKTADGFAIDFVKAFIISSRWFPVDFGVDENKGRILDQFKEVLTVHQGDWKKIFEEIGPGLMQVPVMYGYLLHLVDPSERPSLSFEGFSCDQVMLISRAFLHTVFAS